MFVAALLIGATTLLSTVASSRRTTTGEGKRVAVGAHRPNIVHVRLVERVVRQEFLEYIS